MLKVKLALDQHVVRDWESSGWQNVLLVKLGSKGKWVEAARHPTIHCTHHSAEVFAEEDLVEIFARLAPRV